MMIHRPPQYSESIAKLFPEFRGEVNDKRVLTRTLTFQVTDSCNLACTYCYQTNKGTRVMSFETAKLLIDSLLAGEKGYENYIHPSFSPAIVIDFIGGEPFLQIELIDKICDYFLMRCIELDHPWATMHRFSMCSNGTLYFDEKVQRFLNKHKDSVALSITIDGNKELHDSCRIFPDGSPSYDKAIAAVNDWKSRGYHMGSKITIAPENITKLYGAVTHMIDTLEYKIVNANCVFEDVWKDSDARILYDQMKRLSDYIIDNDLYNDVYLSLFGESLFHPMDENDLQNWCGGTGSMLSCDPDGYLYPCIRYMESSLGNTREPMRIGNVYDGVATKQSEKDCLKCLNCITRRTESTDECFYCPIAAGCAWCSAYNYQVFGTANKRTTFTCKMHKARSLANVYHWNNVYKKTGIRRKFEMHCPREWALEIISEEEYNMLLELCK